MPNDALTQFLVRIAELKRNLATYEVGSRVDNCLGSPNTTEIHMRAVKREIAEYERAITVLIPRKQNA
jgi:hypothetical protein